MKADPDQPHDHHELRAALAKSGLIKLDQEIEFIAIPSAFPRRSRSRRWHYQISSHSQVICHLIVGLDLASVHARAEEFFRACPELACRPLFFEERADGLSFLCLEHFSGTTLDALVEQGECTVTKWLELVRQAQAILEKTRRPSDLAGLEQEIAKLQNEVATFPGLTRVDAEILRALAQPALLHGACTEPLTTCWSNGDFSGRNLLIAPQGGMRLIDYEFAAPTHFSSGDWLRLAHFSILPPAWNESSIPEMAAVRKPWREIWFWLHHLFQLSNAAPSEAVTHHIADCVSRLFFAINQSSTSQIGDNQNSLLINLLSTQENAAKALAEERTVWAKSLDTELRQALDVLAQQTKLAEERLNWAHSMEAEQAALKASFDRLTKEYADRTTWAESLEDELKKARAAFALQAKLAAERTAWAQSLATELQATQDSFAKVSREFTERTAWARSLDVELQATIADRQTITSKHRNLQAACTALTTILPAAAGMELSSAVHKGITVLTELRRDLLVKQAATNAAAGTALEARLRAEVAETEVARLKRALTGAQPQVDQLLTQAKNLQQSLSALDEQQQLAEKTIRQREQDLAGSIAELQATRRLLAPFESNWICRLAARSPATSPTSPPAR